MYFMENCVDVREEYSQFKINHECSGLYKSIKGFLLKGYRLDNIFVRFVRSENLDRIIEFGSDRNIDFVGNKVSFDSFSSKMDLRIYTEFGLTPNQFTYCCDGYYLPKICGVQIERQQTKAGTLQVDKADDKVLMVVYDSTKMRTVIADVKKFEDDPRNCLLRVYLMLLK